MIVGYDEYGGIVFFVDGLKEIVNGFIGLVVQVVCGFVGKK